MFNKKSIVLTVIFILLLAGFGAHWYFNKKTEFQPSGAVSQSETLPNVSQEEYAVYKEEFLGLVDTRDPKFALTKLRERLKTDNALLRSCHALVHDIGHAAYEKYGDFGEALKYQDEICNSGYLHGVIEAHFFKSDDVFIGIETVCSSYPLGKYLSWECFHGVGHGAMYYTSNDLPKSLNLCDKYETFAREACVNGVFMENFNTDQKVHPSKFLKEDDPFYPCQEEASRYKSHCYVYAPTYYLSLHNRDYLGALKWCESAEFFYKSTCVQGVGSQAIKEHINNPKLVEKICMSNTLAQANSCIGGMVDQYITHYGSLEPAQKLCDKLEPSHRKTCHASIQKSSILFD